MSPTNDVTQYLTFFVHGEEYAVEILRVREVMETQAITRVPSTPAAIRGVVNVRGSVVPIVDLGVRFGWEEIDITRFTCIVVVEVGSGDDQTAMGLLVDRVSQVVELGEAGIEDVPPFGANVRIDFLRGMGSVGDKFVMLLDVDRVLSTRDLLEAAQIAEHVEPAGEAVVLEAEAP